MPFLRLERPPTWVVEELEWDPSRNEAWESVCTLSNGYMGVRGFPEEPFDAGPSSSGIYLAGVFCAGKDKIPELVNVTNFLAVDILLGGRPFRMTPETVSEYRRILGLKRGLLQRSMIYTEGGRATRLEIERFVSMSNMHVVGQSLTITPLNWRGNVEVRLWLDASNRPPFPKLRLVHSEHMGRDRILMATQTDNPSIRIAHACRCASWIHGRSPLKPDLIGKGDRIGFRFASALETGQQAAFERMISTYTSRDPDTESVERGCLQDVRGTEGGAYGVRRRLHVEAWQRRWERSDIAICGGSQALEDQRALRFAIFQLIQHSPPHDITVSIAAKGLTGRGYRGHVFWDTEIFMLPFYVASDPPAARRLIRYRLATMDGARRKAQGLGYRGAMFAWESADSGDETCPPYVPDPKTGTPVRVLTGDLQHHVTADVVHAAWQYFRVAQDTAFEERGLLTLTVEAARFWASRVVRHPSLNLYEIRNVIGPDEYHERVDNNTYTNYMAAWNLRLAASEVEHMRRVHRRSRLLRELGVSRDESASWRQIAGEMYLPKPTSDGVWEQHEGFFRLRSTDPRRLSALVSPMPEKDRIGEIRQAQVLKQADILMLMVLFPDTFSPAARRANWDYYEPRTTHDSSLSPSIHSIAASDIDLRQHAYDYFRRSAFVDLDDSMGNTNTGLHMAAIGGTWQSVVRGFLRLDLTRHRPRICPHLPEAWQRVAMQVQHRGRWYRIEASRDSSRVTPCGRDGPSIKGQQPDDSPAQPEGGARWMIPDPWSSCSGV